MSSTRPSNIYCAKTKTIKLLLVIVLGKLIWDNRFDTEIREECDNRFAIFHCHWKSMDSWVGTINTQHYGTTAKTG
jgi:hypothetical protein